MGTIAALLAALSVVAFAPAGATRAEIWGAPKVLALTGLILFNLAILTPRIRTAISLLAAYRPQIICWLLFLLAVVASGIRSPYQQRALYGQGAIATGLETWALVFLLVATTWALSSLRPTILGAQLIGFGIGGLVASMAVLVQAANPTIDLTVTSGQLVAGSDRQLISSIFLHQMPIGLNLHRGQAGAVLFLTLVLGFWEAVGPSQKLTKEMASWFWRLVLLAASIAIVQVRTRAPWISAASGIIALTVLAVKARLATLKIIQAISIVVAGVAVGILLGNSLGWNETARRLPSPSAGVDALASGRLTLWRLAIEGVRERPLLGWGSDGFGIMLAHRESLRHGETLRSMGDNYFYTLDEEGQVHARPIATNKAHNVVLDILVSYGVVGLVAYGAVILTTLQLVRRSKSWPVLGILIAYGLYLVTWYDAVGHLHMVWWAASAMTTFDNHNGSV